MKGESDQRRINEAPFCWQTKAALRRIREAFDATHNVESAIAVYVALTEIASDEQRETVTTTHAWIAQMSGASPRTVFSRLKDLEEIGLVKISTPKLRAPSTFTLLSVSQRLRNEPQPLPSVSQRTKTASLRASEESKEESKEESLKRGVSKKFKSESIDPRGI